MGTTTVRISKSLKRKLVWLKAHPNEAMDQLIGRLADSNIDYVPLSPEEIKGLERGLADIKAGRVYTMSQVKKKLGLK